ncbi:unnamed protein product (macronuclear) [Paramecium tetraurelia]|uniref:SHSP domain-containing protein n=1 Tax=Paramecium tetraurelia TaxID=5888 RepID=A0BV42_PARTE|nr:uncharacterized protein GSPATT00005655001 [Paramecium tetraurelia]CAK62409.1 unnamed protein product [Paramecium tetraurelia]|eukprot:XP_001429807.1 hypothetical protein (macronuclear) [Paramecium tetraurelia strain d4-2]
MNIFLNGQNTPIMESTTFSELLQRLGITDYSKVIIYRNDSQLILQNYNCQVKGFLYANDRISIQVNNDMIPMQANVPYRPIINTTPNFYSSEQNQTQNPQHRATNAQFPINNSQGLNPSFNQQFNFPQGQQQKFQQFNQQPSQQYNQTLNQQQNQQFSQQFSQPFNQTLNPPTNPTPQYQQPKIQTSGTFQNNFQPQPQTQKIDFPVNNNVEEDVFSTQFQNQTYDQQRQNYLNNKMNNPGEYNLCRDIDGFKFTLDNYGDVLIIEKADQSLQLRITSAYKMNKGKRQSTPLSTNEFESNVRMELNYTRVALIQNKDILAVQFNTGDKIFINLHME